MIIKQQSLRIALFFWGLLNFQTAQAEVDQVKFVGLTNCPYICDERLGMGPGLVAEVIAEALARSQPGQPFTFKSKSVNDNRARVMVSMGMAESTVGLSAFFNLNPRVVTMDVVLFQAAIGLVTRNDGSYSFAGFDDPAFIEKRMVWPEGTLPPEGLDELFALKRKNKTLIEIEGDAMLYTNGNRLIANNVADMMFESYDAMRPAMDGDANADKLLLAKMEFGFDFFLGFNPTRPKGQEFGRLMNEGLKIMERDGSLDELRAKYLN